MIHAVSRLLCRDRQRGSIVLPAAVSLLVGIILLGSAQLGYYFYMKREVQKAVDLAALAAAQQLDRQVGNVLSCQAARQGAQRVLTANLAQQPLGPLPAVVIDSALNDADTAPYLKITCGHWSPGNTGLTRPVGVADTEAPWFFRHDPGGGVANAVRVRASLAVPTLFPFVGGGRVWSHAVATQEAPAAAFSVGSQLLRFNSATPLGSVLKLVGVDPALLTLVDGSGLANVRLTPSGLLDALGVPVAADITAGGLNALLSARQLTVGDLLNATASAVGQDAAAVAALNVIGNTSMLEPHLGLRVRDLSLNLGSDGAAHGLFAQIVAPSGDARSALSALVNVGDLVKTAILVAATDGLAPGERSGVAIPGLALAGIQARAGIVEPPRMAIGGVGARAYNAQVRLFVDVDTDKIPLLGTITRLLDTRVHLPITIDVVNGHAELTSLQCNQTPRSAEIEVRSSLLRTCVGRVDEPFRFSARDVCESHLQPMDMVRVLGQTVVNTPISLNALPDNQRLTFLVDDAHPLPQTHSTQPNALALGTTVQNLTNALLGTLNGLLRPAGSQGITPGTEGATAGNLADRYLDDPYLKINGRYDVSRIIQRLRDGKPADAAGQQALPGLGNWTAPGGVPYACGLLNLSTCWQDGSVWLGFERSVTGAGRGVVSGLLGTLLGGLVLTDCTGLVSQLLTYNQCVRNNLVSYLQTKPGGVQDAGGGGACASLLCTLLNPVVATLRPILNGLGSLLSTTLANVLGLEVGRTDVTLYSLGCSRANLVY